MDVKREFREDEVSLFGWVIFPTFVLYDRRLTPSQKILYCILRRYSRENGYCFPSISRIANGLNVSIRAIHYNLLELINCGLITKVPRSGHSTIYKFVEMKDVYTDKGRLKDFIIEDLKFAGEDKNVSLVMQWRSDNELGNVDTKKLDTKKDVEITAYNSIPKGRLPVRNFELTHEAIAEKEERGRLSTERRNKRKSDAKNIDELEKQRRPKQDKEHRFSSRDVENAWRVAANNKWPDTLASQKWDRSYLTIAKRLGEKFGYEFVIEACEYIIEKWEDISDRYNLNVFPNMKLVAYFADMWFSEFRTGQNLSDPRRVKRESRGKEALKKGEYNAESAKEYSQKHGPVGAIR